MRFVENDKIPTAAGLTSGIDLALHVVRRILRARRRPGYYRPHGDHGALWKNPELATVETEAAGW
jgi:hypothetical protein